MKTNRRSFFKIAGVAGAGVLSGGLTSCVSNDKNTPSVALPGILDAVGRQRPQLFNMSGYAAPKLDVVRIGFIGLGMRGPGAVERIANIEGVEIKALCDEHMDRVENTQKILSDYGLPAAKAYGGSKDAWKEMCRE